MSSSGLTSNVCHTYGSAPRGSNLGGQRLSRPTAHSPQRGGWRLLPETAQGAGPAGESQARQPERAPRPGGKSSQVSPPLPFPSSQSHAPRPPKNPSPQREIIHSHGPLKVYRSLPAVEAAGLCSHPSRAPIQDHELEKPQNYNPHNDPRLSRSRREGWRPRASDRGPSMAVTRAPHGLLSRSRRSLLDSLPRCRRLADCWLCGPGQVGWGWSPGHRSAAVESVSSRRA